MRVLSVTILVQYVIYVPYADLLPGGFFRYLNVHYFAWTFPWLVMLTVGSIEWVLTSRRLPSGLGVAGTVFMILMMIATLCLRLHAKSVGSVAASVAGPQSVVVELNVPKGVDFIDFTGIEGSWSDIYSGANSLERDGLPLRRISDFKLVQTEQGLRLILPMTIFARRLVLVLDPKIKIDKEILSARPARASPSLICWIKNCDLPELAAPLPVVTGPVVIDFDNDAGSGPYLTDGWSGPETWGRWSSSAKADIEFRLDRNRHFSIETMIQPVLSNERPQQTVTIIANGCSVAEGSFSFPADVEAKEISGEVPESCVPADGRVRLEIATDQVVSPKGIGVGEDDRMIGFGVRQLKIE